MLLLLRVQLSSRPIDRPGVVQTSARQRQRQLRCHGAPALHCSPEERAQGKAQLQCGGVPTLALTQIRPKAKPSHPWNKCDGCVCVCTCDKTQSFGTLPPAHRPTDTWCAAQSSTPFPPTLQHNAGRSTRTPPRQEVHTRGAPIIQSQQLFVEESGAWMATAMLPQCMLMYSSGSTTCLPVPVPHSLLQYIVTCAHGQLRVHAGSSKCSGGSHQRGSAVPQVCLQRATASQPPIGCCHW